MRRALGVLVVALAVPAAQAQAVETFKGRCQVPFEAQNTKPMSVTPQPGGYDATGTGTCTGTLGGRRIRREPVTLTAHVDDERSGCMSGKGTGTIDLVFRRLKRKLELTFHNPIQDNPAIDLRGDGAGSGVGYFTAYTQMHEQDPAGIEHCAEGTVETWKGEWRLLATREAFPVRRAEGASRTREFDGTCDVVGQARTDVPMGVVPVHGGYSFKGTGSCAGTLDGQPVESAPVELEMRLDDRMLGCASGLSTSEAVLRFASGRPMRLRADHPGPTMFVRGTDGGLAVGIFTILTELADHSPDAAAACADGTQIGEGPMRWTVRTLSPLRG